VRQVDLPSGGESYCAAKAVWSSDSRALMVTLAIQPCHPQITHSIVRVEADSLAVTVLVDPDSRLFAAEAWPEGGRVLLVDKDKGRRWLDASSGEITPAQ
jgi:hypothetical protein